MNEKLQKKVVLKEEESVFDFKQLCNLFMLKRNWFIVSILACLLLPSLYLWFIPTRVTVTGKLEIIDRSKKGNSAITASLAMLNNLPFGIGGSLGGGASFAIDSEKEILMSNTLVCHVVKYLGLYTEYRLRTLGRKPLLYQNSPVVVSLDPFHVQWLDSELPLTYHQINLTITKVGSGYEVEPVLIENSDEMRLPVQTFSTLPAMLKTDAGTLTLTENKLPAKQIKAYEDGYTLQVTITPPTRTADAFIKRLSAETPTMKVNNMLTLSLVDESPIRGIDFINQLVEAYNQRANDEKNEEALKTDEFVNARLAKIDQELGFSDAAWEKSKKNFQITTPEVDAAEVMGKKSIYETQLVAVGTELQLHDYLSEYVNNPANLYEIIPSAISSIAQAGLGTGLDAVAGLSSKSTVGTASLMEQHNTLVNQRKELLKSVSEMSPLFKRVTQSIQELHPVIVTALKRDRQSIVMRQSTLQREYNKYMDRVGRAPQMERVLTEIGRQREIKQGAYLLMLQKREETAMELANTTDRGKLYDAPAVVPGSTKPQKKIVLFVFFFLGILLPMVILFLIQMFKQRIDILQELETATKLPIVGEIPLQENGDAIRDLRTNLLLNLKEGQKSILVASNAPGDGKSYIAQHLVESLNAIGKKTFLIDGDLRKNPSSIIHHPSDVLAGEAFAKQMAEAKTANDYVIIDSPAISKYTDAYQLVPFADATLYVVKSGVTDKSDIKALCNDARLPAIMLVLNAVDTTSKMYKLLNKK